MTCALAMNDCISLDRNWDLSPDKKLPRGEIVPEQFLLEQVGPDFSLRHPSGGALWYDAMVFNSERLVLAFIQSAVQGGLDVINYCPVTGVRKEKNTIASVKVRDVLSSREFEIQGDFVINCSGAWVDKVRGMLSPERPKPPLFTPCRVMNLITRKRLFPGNRAVGLFGKKRTFFFVPWRHFWMIGTHESDWNGDPDHFTVQEKDIAGFLKQLHEVAPEIRLQPEDICFVHKGLLPSRRKGSPRSPAEKVILYDHAESDGINNALSLLPVKYTTARGVAQETLGMFFKKTGKPFQASRSSKVPLHGGETGDFSLFYNNASAEIKKKVPLNEKIIRHFPLKFLRQSN